MYTVAAVQHMYCACLSTAAVYHFSVLHLQRHCSDKSNVLFLSIIISYFSYYSMSAVVTAAAITYRNQSAVLFKQLPIAPTSTRESFFIHFLILQPHQIQTYSLTISHQVSSVTRSNQSRWEAWLRLAIHRLLHRQSNHINLMTCKAINKSLSQSLNWFHVTVASQA